MAPCLPLHPVGLLAPLPTKQEGSSRAEEVGASNLSFPFQESNRTWWLDEFQSRNSCLLEASENAASIAAIRHQTTENLLFWICMN